MPQNPEQLQKFQQVYNALNKEQKEAVDTIEGPVMVIAGPGTGKTQILSARIGNILLKTDGIHYFFHLLYIAFFHWFLNEAQGAN